MAAGSTIEARCQLDAAVLAQEEDVPGYLPNIIHLNDYLLRVVAPLDVSQDPTATLSGGSCTGRVLDRSRMTELTAAVGIAASSFIVSDVSGFAVGDTLLVRSDTGFWMDLGAIATITSATKTITTSGVTNATAAIGNAVVARVGDEIAMPVYGTPAVGTFDWGYGGVISDQHSGLAPGMELVIEIDLQAGTDLRLRRSFYARVVGVP